MKLYLLLFFTLFTKTLFCQDKYPKDYFSPPLKIPIILAGTFGELRSNHFHAGIDIKTQGREGIPIFAPADGYVSRIKIGQYGYGKALYINHPNGYTTIYAHLKRFAKNIQNFVKTNQYKKKKYAIGNLFPKQNKFIYKKGDIIGYTGDTGSSGGPHLHYEIRDTKTEKIINPLLFNLDVLDSIKPTIKQLMVYPIDGATVNNSNNKAILDFKKIEEGKYITDRITAAGKIGFGIYLFDRLNNASNKNGIYSLEMKVNGNTVYYHDVETFSFSESKFINLHIDYSHYKKYRKRFQKTYIDTVNKLSTYENLINNGIINIEKKNNYIVEIIGSDFKKNTTTIRIPVKGVKNNYKKQELDTTGYKINCNNFNKFKLQNVTLAFPSKSFYNNCFINFKIDNGVAHIHKPTIPLNKKYTLTFGTSHLSEAQQQQVYIANVTNPKYPRYVSTKKKVDKVYTSTKSLGNYTLNFDTKKPTIKLLNFQNGKWISKNKTLKVRIRDKETGIKNYKATIDNKWILMEYNHKKGILTYDFSDKKLVGSKHIFKIIVSDNVGNTKILKATFFKKIKPNTLKQLIIILFFPVFIFAQKTAILKGKVTDRNNNPIENVAITYSDKGTTSDKNGNYKLSIPIHKTTVVTFSHISFEKKIKKFTARGTKTFNYFPKLEALDKNLKEVVVKNRKKEAQGMLKINSKKMNDLIGANAGVENILMTLPGVNNNNELSTQYNVRGGNFDENLVYVNGIEVYRPFLIRSGQQEGLSFINSQMVQNINFSAGGFQARYGDRLSSVLDITYRKPQSFKAQIDLSLLGANISVENSYLNNQLNVIVGVRYRDNSLFVNNKQTEVNFRPQFTDFQTYLSYKYSNKLTLNFLSNFSLNKYNYKPLTRKTRFGGFVNPIELVVFYQGQEKDEFKTLFGAFSADYKINENLKLTGTISSFNTQEEEYFDIAAAYNLGEINTSAGSENFGEVEFSQGIGSQINHARNDLDALINAIQIRASLKKGKNEWQAGIKYQTENIRDKINEWEIIDSVGFSVRPPNSLINNQPYESYSGPIEPYQNVKAKNTIDTKRITGFVQLSRKTFIENHELWMNFGVRVHHWNIKANALNQKSNTVISPRIQLAIKPNWNADMLFRLSGGWYAQPPFYKEFRGYDGLVNPDVKAQKSIHIVTGNDYSFKLWNRPFKLTTEIYYKNLTEINAYSIDNVRIRYRADNLTNAYAYGIDMRLNGEFVPGNESWVSFGYLKTEENINDRGYIARPTDQRIKFGVLFQDYIPNLPNLKAYLNVVYNTGLPGGAPAYSDVYKFQNKLNDYKRADIGISYVLTDINKPVLNGFLSKFKELTVGFELFNIFDIRNAITNTWVRDAYSKQQYGIPNYMTGRVLNLKLGIKF